MSKRILITSTDLMMVQFLLPHVRNLWEHGYEVEIACSDVGGRMNEIREKLDGIIKAFHTVRLRRSPVSPENFKGYGDMKKIISQGHYDLIWTNEPVMGVVTRLAARKARKQGTKILYMVHGYHFFRGCPAKLKIFYPIERIASRFCDAIATINTEDYEITREKFHAQQVFHLNGIGIDLEKFSQDWDKGAIREKLGIPQDAFVLISVGELNPHKNHRVIIDALAQLKNPKVFYLICGKGELLQPLREQATRLQIENQVRFLGYRRDIPEILHGADIFAFPSLREGLGLASLEAMAAGLPVLGADTRGIRDYVINGETGYLCRPDDPVDFAERIRQLQDEELRRKLSKECVCCVKKYGIDSIKQSIKVIIREVLR